MLRVERVRTDSLSKRSLYFIANFNAIKQELTRYLGSSIAKIFCAVEDDGQYFNFYSDEEGSVKDSVSSASHLTDSSQKKIDTIKAFVQDESCPSVILKDNKDNLLYFLDHREHSFVIDDRAEVFALFESKEDEARTVANLQRAKAAATTTAVPVATGHRFGPLCFFIPLALLLVLFFLWWFFMRPAPFTGDFANYLSNLPPQVSFVTDKEKAQIEELNAKLQENKATHESELNDIKANLDAKDKELEDLANKTLEQKEENARLTEDNARLQAKIDELEAAQKEAQANANANVANGTAENAKAESASNKGKPQASKAVANTAQNKGNPVKKLPKCVDLKAKKQLPRLLIGFDGSLSMLENDFDNSFMHTRLILAKNAVNDMLPKLDKSVSVGIIEIRGCPAAKNRGMYSLADIGRIKAIINGITPVNTESGGGTPLSSGLLAIGNMAGTGNDVAMLITDGMDSCMGPEICSLARSIHKMKPNLKVNLLSISNESYRVKCVADITGGKVYSINNLDDFAKHLEAMSQEMRQGQVCSE